MSILIALLTSLWASGSQCVTTETYRVPGAAKDAKAEPAKPIVFLAEKEEKAMPDVDAATFRILRAPTRNPIYDGDEQCNERYAKDFKQAYYRGEAIKGADPLTFEYLGKGYARDKSTVYLNGAKQPDLNAKSFRVK